MSSYSLLVGGFFDQEEGVYRYLHGNLCIHTDEMHPTLPREIIDAIARHLKAGSRCLDCPEIGELALNHGITYIETFNPDGVKKVAQVYAKGYPMEDARNTPSPY